MDTSNTQIKIKPLRTGFIMPKRATDGSAAYDVFVTEHTKLQSGRQIIPLGFAIEMPENMALDIRTRSGYAAKGLLVHDIHGKEMRIDADVLFVLVDSDYRKEVGVLLNVRQPYASTTGYYLSYGQAIAQMKFCTVPKTELVISDELSTTERTGGFGEMNGE